MTPHKQYVFTCVVHEMLNWHILYTSPTGLHGHITRGMFFIFVTGSKFSGNYFLAKEFISHKLVNRMNFGTRETTGLFYQVQVLYFHKIH